MRTIIINTDASYSQEENVGGFAFWIKSENFKVTKAGMLPGHVDGPAQAELLGIGQAISALLSQKDLQIVDSLILNTDSKPAISQIDFPTIMEAVEVSRLWSNLIKRVKPRFIDIKHVKAHTGSLHPRSFINEWCDKEAKKWMRKAVHEKLIALKTNNLREFA